MIRNILLTLTIICAVAMLTSCAKPSPDDIAAKIEHQEELSSSDYDVMLDYLQQATDAMIPRLKATRTVADMEIVENEIQKEFPMTDIFNTALLLDFPKLSASQTERMAAMRSSAQEAVSGKKF